MKRKAVPVLFTLVILFRMGFVARKEKPGTIYHFKKIEEKIDESPSKIQYLLRATVDPKIPKKDLKVVTKAAFKNALSKNYKDALSPTHVFIYVYPNTDSVYESNWIAKYTRINKVDDKSVSFKN